MRDNIVKNKSFKFAISKEQFNSINADAVEIIKLITSIIKTTKSNTPNH